MKTAVTPAEAPAGLRRVLVTLCATVITSWGVLFYALPVLAGDIAADTGWSTTGIIAALSASQLVAAGAGVPIGRWLDHHGPRGVMTAGSVLAVVSLVAVSAAPGLGWFIAAWSVAGVAMGATLYAPAFSAVTRWHGPGRVRALTILTLVGGLASTVFAPLTALLAESLDWRATYLVLAAILGAITIPGHWFGLSLPWPPRPRARPQHSDPGRISRSREFVVLTIAFSVAAFATSAVVINLIPLLAERGIDTATAAMALGLGGAGQVAGRLGYGVLARHTTPRSRTAVILAAMAVTTAVLGVLTTVTALIVAAVLAGVARGVFTLIKATAVSDRWGSAHYGRLSGVLSAPLTVSTALAPFAGAALAEAVGGYSTAFLILGAITLAGALLALATAPSAIKDA
ncbi:Predicted arabinose efflux permease, MFS family [Actinokineospora alba]|uniref:Predicted arabinose efflux permease, MFS family n=1 Tax=Actinokineospora alba TaxID=504798 RepID=A0A1H0NAQ1_9PSEU|nr:MFS transporter [Actinokineospora alba]TDP68650.1 putative MFS family arabinose efflux permease [Actinokineospora alba]SDH83626.1 Predicted arabinose efflux permease, MFS family [Actinokineospora alba]SDO89777.1 Predicted arabinose efflux permease, MFS family [Actinokineospora alba]